MDGGIGQSDACTTRSPRSGGRQKKGYRRRLKAQSGSILLTDIHARLGRQVQCVHAAPGQNKRHVRRIPGTRHASMIAKLDQAVTMSAFGCKADHFLYCH